MKERFNRRALKNYFILKDVQLKIISINFIHMLLVVLITLAAVVIPLYLLLVQSPSIEDQYHAAIYFIIITEPVPLALFLVLILFIAHQIIITHQFCGPIVNFSNSFRAIAQGNLTRRVHLRKHDLLKKEAAEINEMTDKLCQRIGGMKQEHACLLDTLQSVCANTQGIDTEKLTALKSALQQARDIQSRYDYFTVTDSSSERN